MVLIPVVVFVFTLGLAWNPKTEITLITDTGTEKRVTFEHPVTISKDGESIILVEAKPSRYSEKHLFPFRRTSFGDITVDCLTDCHEALDK